MSARELRVRKVASTSARVAGTRQSMGHSNESGYSRGPGAHSRVTTGGKAELCCSEKTEWKLGDGWVFLQVIVQFAFVVLHTVQLYLAHWIWGSLAGSAGITL